MGTPSAWGSNGWFQVGDGTDNDPSTPVQTYGLTSITQVAAGGSAYHSLALKADGTVWAGGFGYYGERGAGGNMPAVPVQVSGLTSAVAIATGAFHSLAVTLDGSVWTWGDNGEGELGNGTLTNENTPVQVPGLTGAIAVAGGYGHSLALKSDGTVWAWGRNVEGQLGDGTTSLTASPVQVSGLTGVTAVAGGGYGSLALKSDGTVWAWGENSDGQLGDGTTVNQRTPVQVSGLSGVTAIAAGGGESFAVNSDETVSAWGNNSHGQLGDGTTVNQRTPVQVSGLTGVTAVAAGEAHTLAVKSDGSLWAWGSNSNGQLGDGTTVDESTPVQVSGLTGVTKIAAGDVHSVAVQAATSSVVPSHVPSWGVDDVCTEGTGASPPLVQAWLTYAESQCGPKATKALDDCHTGGQAHCLAIQYMDAELIYPGVNESVPIAGAAQESWWLHEPGFSDQSHRVTISNQWGTADVLNDANPAVDSWFQNYVRTNYDAYDGLMMDDVDASTSLQLYLSGFSTSQEIGTDDQLDVSHRDMAQAMTHSNGQPFPQIDNGTNPNPYLRTGFSLLDNPAQVHGLVAEGHPMSFGKLSYLYSAMLDEEAYVDGTRDASMVLLSYDQAGSSAARRVQEGSVMLGYAGDHIVDWADLETASTDLAVWPEEGIVPTQPIQTMSKPSGSGCSGGTGGTCNGGHKDVEVAPDVYRREFAQCYNRGVPIGPCAAIVNATSSPVIIDRSWLSLAYTNEISFGGGDVQSGGTLQLAGPAFSAGQTAVPANDAILIDDPQLPHPQLRAN